jgi:mannose-6-phosphate isomerase-like protein (cupin superfamily)
MSKNKYVTRFDKATAPGGHSDTILAGRALPEGMKAPFGDAWGYLEGKSMMEAHSHPTDEVYFVFKGKGYCHIGDERFAIEPGDVIQVPPDVTHTMECEDGNSLLWVALWWEKIK